MRSLSGHLLRPPAAPNMNYQRLSKVPVRVRQRVTRLPGPLRRFKPASGRRRLLAAHKDAQPTEHELWGPLAGRQQLLMSPAHGERRGAAALCARALSSAWHKISRHQPASHPCAPPTAPTRRPPPPAGERPVGTDALLLAQLEAAGALWSEHIPDDAWLVLAAPGFEDSPAATAHKVVSVQALPCLHPLA